MCEHAVAPAPWHRWPVTVIPFSSVNLFKGAGGTLPPVQMLQTLKPQLQQIVDAR